MPKPKGFRSKGKGKERKVYPIYAGSSGGRGRSNFTLKAKVDGTIRRLHKQRDKKVDRQITRLEKKGDLIAKKIQRRENTLFDPYASIERKRKAMSAIKKYQAEQKQLMKKIDEILDSHNAIFHRKPRRKPSGVVPKLSTRTRQRWKRLGFTKEQIDEAEYRGIDLETDIGA